MLSDLDVDNLIQPFVDRQNALERYVIQLIAEHVRKLGQALPSDIHRLEQLYLSGSDAQKINKEIARITGLQVYQIKEVLRYVAQDSYIDAKPFYDYRHKPYIPFAKNKPMQRLVRAIGQLTANTFKNLSDSRANGFVIRDLKHPGKTKFYNIQDTYKSVIDEAVQAASQGVTDYKSAMRRTMKQLNESGIQHLTWESGYKQRTDSAVKRNILDGIRRINQKIHELLGKEMEADGVEISVHHAPAPDHAPFQGHIFKNKEYEKLQNNQPFKDIKWKKFTARERVVGQWNCKHFAYPIIIGVQKPRYSDKELQDILDENNKGITFNGKHMTLYEATQYQNAIALKVRKAKDGQMMAQTLGDGELALEYARKIKRYSDDYKHFNQVCASQCPTWADRPDKLTVQGYKRISTKSA